MAKKLKSIFIRLTGLLVVIAAAVILIGLPLAEKRTERRVRAMLLAVQEGLQRYHVAEELYPKKRMSGAELVSLLAEGGFVEKTLLNPWTGLPYAGGSGEDRLHYRTNSLAETYELVVTFPGTEEAEFRLDSTENQSLE
jgi:hypothetical protein